MKNKEQTSSNKQLKKWKILTGVFAGLTAVGIATSITLPLVLNKNTDTPVPTPVPSTHGFDVEGKEYKVGDDGKIAFTITCNEKDNHVLKNIKLFNGETQLGETIASADMRSGNATVTFTNVTFTDKTNSAKITFNVEGLEGTETISRITINNATPTPTPTEDIIYEGSFKQTTTDKQLPIRPQNYPQSHIAEQIAWKDVMNTYISSSSSDNIGNMIAYEFAKNIPGETGALGYDVSVQFNYTQSRMTCTKICTFVDSVVKIEFENVPFYLGFDYEAEDLHFNWVPYGYSTSGGIFELAQFDNWSIKMTSTSGQEETTDIDLTDESSISEIDEANDYISYVFGSCEYLENVTLKF